VSEHDEQVALVKWARLAAKQHPELSLLFAIPNGGARSKATAGRLKAEGVLPGMPDVCLPSPQGLLGACYIELKRPKSPGKPAGVESPAQKAMRKALNHAGNYAVVCYGWEEARDALLWYLDIGAV
jgi:hypothetical protein